MRASLLVPVLVLGYASDLLAQPISRPTVFETDVITHADISNGAVPLKDIRKRGMAVFSTPFTKEIGYGDGPVNLGDKTSPGGRPSLQNNGLFLRVNGLDAQTCMECHSIGSNAFVPFRFGVGGVGGSSTNAMFMTRNIDVDDSNNQGFADFDGRFINPPFLFGSGGVELAGKEMTQQLQLAKEKAKLNPGTVVPLVALGVNFGTISFVNGQFDTSAVEGVDEDLVVRPFGRKGEFASVRAFDVGALRFHFGMEPVEDVGLGVDNDGDGVVDEASIGDLSAISIFNTHLERPIQDPLTPGAAAGADIFSSIGCATCHVPVLKTHTPFLTYSFPEVLDDPSANVFFSSDLRQTIPGFDPSLRGGIEVPLFSDLKRHDMGPDLAETFGAAIDAQFITARLWGVADTAPYLHDGRAHTIEDAILMHGGEAQQARNRFSNLSAADKGRVLAYLFTLRTPVTPAADIQD